MNFDINTLSTLMQMMSAQKPRESESVSPAGDSSTNYYQNPANPQGRAQSVFAMQNGLGQRIDLEPKPEKKSQSASNPMSAIFDMMGGKGGGASADMMSNLLPMFMNMMSKPAQVASDTTKNKHQENKTQGDQSFEQKLKNAMDNVSNNQTGLKQDSPTKNSDSDIHKQNMQNKQSNGVKSNISRDRYSPISFAGYALICSLNKLYMAKKYELR